MECDDSPVIPAAEDGSSFSVPLVDKTDTICTGSSLLDKSSDVYTGTEVWSVEWLLSTNSVAW